MSVGRGRSAAASAVSRTTERPLEAASDLVISGEAEVTELAQRADPFRRCRAAGHRQHPDRFDVTVTALRTAECLTRERSAGGCHRVDRVGLAFPAAHLPVRTVDLDHGDPGPLEMTGQPGPVRTGALHPDQIDLAVGAHPVDQSLIPGFGGLEGFDAEHPADVVDHGGHVDIGVRVDARGH